MIVLIAANAKRMKTILISYLFNDSSLKGIVSHNTSYIHDLKCRMIGQPPWYYVIGRLKQFAAYVLVLPNSVGLLCNIYI